jgi:hypothetical protein
MEKENIIEKESKKKKLNCSISEILLKYFDLVEDYVNTFKKNIKINNINHKNVIFNKGLSCIIIIYSVLLINTNNLNLVITDTKKGFYYYIEFIEQILSNKNLNLTTHDALLFVYKKTINNLKTKTQVISVHNKIKILLQLYNFLLLEHINLNTLYIDNQIIKHIKDLIIDISKLKSIKKTTEISNYLLYQKYDLLSKIQYVKQHMLKH